MLRKLLSLRSFATMTRQPLTKPLIAVVGATGTGKSQLAVSLAKRFNGEVINGDAMQLYSGLPIITNKITIEEQQGIPHHLLGCIGLEEQTWVVGTFVKKALETIDDIHRRGKLPVLVGGTHYYTQSLLFEDQLAEDDDGTPKSQDSVDDIAERWPILREPTAKLLEELERVDPIMADRWHPNDRRKIQRSLEIYLQTGRKASDIYAEQERRRQAAAESTEGESSGGTHPRFPTLLFWVRADNEVLQERQAKRIDKMLHAGLLDEVETLSSFAEMRAAAGHAVDESRGIWVSIGYKEFKSYCAAMRTAGGVAEADLAQLKSKAVELTKIATRQYAKRQVRWIRIKLAGTLARAHLQQHLFVLDSSDVRAFDANVEEPAAEITEAFLQGLSLPEPRSLSDFAAGLLPSKATAGPVSPPKAKVKHYCELCDVTCVAEAQWKQHTRSHAHRKLIARAREKAEEAPRDVEGFG